MIREETDPEKLLRRGTQITLYLRVCHSSFILFNEIDCACSCYTLLVSMENKIIEWNFLRCCFFSGLYHNDCVVIIPYDS